MNSFGLFKVGMVGIAVPLAQIQKILQGAQGHQLPRLPGAVVAVLVEDGKLVPLIDIGTLLSVESRPLLLQGYQVLLESEYGTVALLADSGGRIVAEQKGRIVSLTAKDKTAGIIGHFVYKSEKFKILDINFLAIEMTQVYWQNQPDTGGARRHQ